MKLTRENECIPDPGVVVTNIGGKQWFPQPRPFCSTISYHSGSKPPLECKNSPLVLTRSVYLRKRPVFQFRPVRDIVCSGHLYQLQTIPLRYHPVVGGKVTMPSLYDDHTTRKTHHRRLEHLHRRAGCSPP